MKTKFSELLKVKKQKVSEIEQQLASVRQKKLLILNEIDKINQDIKSFNYPSEGDYSQLNIALAQKNSLFHEKENKENLLKYCDQEIEKFNIQYKEANIEYEKINHLDNIEIEKKLDEIKLQEAKNLDEIGTQLFVRFIKKEKIV